LIDILELPYHKSTLLKEFKKIVQKIENLAPKSLMIRDFQARNILVNDQDEVFFIDYQAAKYTEADIDILADKIINGGSGVWGEVPMSAHAGMDKENAKKMVKYILTLKK
jgi:hypothetical protein